MTFDEIMLFLEEHGTEQIRKIFINHGATLPLYGVKVGELKLVQKKVKKNYELSMALYDTGIYDARYLAGLIADEKKMTIDDLRLWMATSGCEGIACSPVAWVAAESDHGLVLAREWMQSEDEVIAAAGYATYAGLISITPNHGLDIPEIEGILDHIVEVIHSEREQVKYQMNAFVIAAGGYIPALSEKGKTYGQRIGQVKVDMGNTACKVPLITPYIEKMEARGVKKRKMARCL